MLHFLYGEDQEAARKKLKPSDFSFDSLNWDPVKFEELIYGRDLFGAKQNVFLNKVFELPEAKDFILDNLEQIAGSANIFTFLEVTLNKTELSKVQKHAEEVLEFPLPAKGGSASGGKDNFNVFGVTDALGERDRKKLWVLLQKAYLAGLEGEQIFWSLAWVVKSISIAQNSKSVQESGLKPFVYQKCSRFGRNYTPKEVANLYGDFSRIYHECRRGKDEFDLALERLALTI
ncbi:MAG TPA: hypothetical protein VJJ24_01525 [Candidatus Paceibacterota bacterium]